MNFRTFKTKIKELGFWVGNCFLQMCRSYGAFPHQPINSQLSTFNFQLLRCRSYGAGIFYRKLFSTNMSLLRSFFRFNLSILNLQPSTFNLQPSTFNLQLSTFNLQPSSTVNLRPFDCSSFEEVQSANLGRFIM
jgi:hypothetical protein